MEKELTSKSFFQKLSSFKQIPSNYFEIIHAFYESYKQNAQIDEKLLSSIFDTFLKIVAEQFQNPYQFEPYHQRIRKPFDYYQFGIDFLLPLVDLEHSTLLGKENLAVIQKTLDLQGNVILFANHQIEADPQALSILLKDSYPKIGEEMIFVAGERVISDPLAIPFSMGRNLLCIYSKRYIDNPPEQKEQKQLHNKKTMELMSSLLSEGGKIIYVAPSGGRDRINKKGLIELAPFDPSSIELFYLMTQKAKKKTHFYPLALWTYHLLPPPENIQRELGEKRTITLSPIKASFGTELDLEKFPGHNFSNKLLKREAKADYVFNNVKKEYGKLIY